MVTRAEPDRFHDFAVAKIENGGVESLDECLRLWRTEEAHRASVAALRESIEDSRAGRTAPAAEFEEELRREFGFPPRERAS